MTNFWRRATIAPDEQRVRLRTSPTSNVRFGAGVTREVAWISSTWACAGRWSSPMLRWRDLRRYAHRTRRAGRRRGSRRRSSIGCASSRPTWSFRDAIRVRRNGEPRRDRGRRRRLGDRHGQGGEPLHDVPAGGFARLCQCAHREGVAGAGPAEATDRDSHDGRDGQRDDRRGHLRSHRLHAKTGIARRGSSRRSASSIRTTPGPCRAAGGRVERPRHPEPRRRVVHRLALTSREPSPRARRFARRIRGPTPSATSGRSGAADGRAVPGRAVG